jgi:hypothetical protein
MWPNACFFAQKLAQNVVFSKEKPEENTRPIGEKSSNLVTRSSLDGATGYDGSV